MMNQFLALSPRLVKYTWAASYRYKLYTFSSNDLYHGVLHEILIMRTTFQFFIALYPLLNAGRNGKFVMPPFDIS